MLLPHTFTSTLSSFYPFLSAKDNTTPKEETVETPPVEDGEGVQMDIPPIPGSEEEAQQKKKEKEAAEEPEETLQLDGEGMGIEFSCLCIIYEVLVSLILT